MKVADVRRTFLDFFRERDHRIVPSSPLIPNDPTLLLTNAGMNQFKPFFLGQKASEFKRAASCQKCARTTDIENVGLTARHHSLFEMLGNFSFGDYYKHEIAQWAWELVTEKFGLEPDRLWVTIYNTDDEAFDAWHDGVGIPAEKIVRRGEEDNFWSMGVAGPCGPCSEIFYDRGPEYGDVEGFDDGDRIMEFWNLVFMELEQDATGTIVGPLPARNVDTGMGLERMASILQGVDSNYDIDIFRPILARAEELTGRVYGKDPKTDVSLRIMADHARFSSFLIADGVMPSNEDRGYVLRRVIRRAVRRAKMLGVDEPVMPSLAEVVTGEMGDFYTELVTNRALVQQVLGEEEERFRSTLERGTTMLADEIAKAKGSVPGDVAFKLHDTYGFPLELTAEIASEHGLSVDRDTFERLMTEQRERARGARKTAVAGAEEAYKSILSERGATDFLGYSSLSAETPVVGIIRGTERVPSAGAGDEVELVLARTPFYPEGGGQVGDTGIITLDGAVAEILDTQRALGDLIVHRGRIKTGEIRAGVEASAEVDAARRAAVTRSHTATHILHATLREVLGEHARQAGSLVEAGRLRFDFPHSSAVPPEILERAEEIVNARVGADTTVRPYETTQEYARSVGAIALFGEKYGDIVRVVEVGDYSIELCGGTHVERTAQIGGVKVLGEGSIGANLRRVEALTGADAIAGWRSDRAVLEHIALLLAASPAEAPAKVERLLADLERAEAAIAASRKTAERGKAAELAAKATRIGDAAVLVAHEPGLSVDDMRRLAVETRDAAGAPAVVVLASSLDGKPGIAAAVTKDLVSKGVSAKALISSAARAIGGGGGGKDDVATGGGRNADAIPEALRLATEAARAALGD